MIIDIHAHIRAAPEVYYWQSQLMAASGANGPIPTRYSTEFVRDHPETTRLIGILDKFGTDIQVLSPRPFTQMHAEKPAKMVHYWTEFVNDYIARCVEAYPTRFYGMCGLPQPAGRPIEESLPELDRCITELGFVGTLVDSDPGEGDNQTPTMDDEYWYPLYEKLCALDVPALLHSTGCKHGRESYAQHFISEESLAIVQICNSQVFTHFPNLKIIVAHGGGSVPYQIGRWRAERTHPMMSRPDAPDEDFLDSMKRLYFDTCLHNRDSLKLLIDLVGSDRILFGTENPGSGSCVDPLTGHYYDDIKWLIEGIPSVSDGDRKAIFEDNARRIFPRMHIPA